MDIYKYIDSLEGNSKRHILLVVTPKDKYPINFLEEAYFSLEKAILKNPKEYMSLYGDDPNEIMQFVTFRHYIRPVICDKYSVRYKTTERVHRGTKDELVSFIVAKHYYQNVPNGSMTVEESIEQGLILANEFLSKYPHNKFEHALIKLDKDSNEANSLINISFASGTDSYFFDQVYIH